MTVGRGQVRPALSPPARTQVAGHSFECPAPSLPPEREPGPGRLSGAVEPLLCPQLNDNADPGGGGGSNLLKLHTRRRRRDPNPTECWPTRAVKIMRGSCGPTGKPAPERTHAHARTRTHAHTAHAHARTHARTHAHARARARTHARTHVRLLLATHLGVPMLWDGWPGPLLRGSERPPVRRIRLEPSRTIGPPD